MSALDAIEVNYNVSEDAENQFLTFMLSGEEYGVDILRVQEIRGWESVTTLPNAPDYIKGVINIRGTIVPIVDLRTRFGIENVDYSPITVVIVLRIIGSEDRERVMGIVVDTVSDTYSITEDNLKDAPEFGDQINLDYIQGLATVDDKMLILLDIDRLLNANDLPLVETDTALKN